MARHLIMLTGCNFIELAAAGTMAAAAHADTNPPWYRRTLRWGQTNITERDPVRYDIPWWREYWKRTSIQGVIINAGGIVAYYPSKFPLQHRPDRRGFVSSAWRLVRARNPASRTGLKTSWRRNPWRYTKLPAAPSRR